MFVISYAIKGNIAVFIGEHGNNCAPVIREQDIVNNQYANSAPEG